MILANITDIADLLPTGAAVKLHHIRNTRNDAGDIMRGLAERSMDARQARTAAVERLKHVRQPPSGRAAGDGHPAVETAQRSLDAANAELARLQQHEAVISATFATRDRLTVRIERYLRDAASSGKRFAPAPNVEPRLQKGESILDAIDRVRRQGRTILADIHTTASAPVPSADARKRMRAQIEAMAEIGRPNVSTLIEHVAGKVEFAEVFRNTLGVSEIPQADGNTQKFGASVGWQEPDAVALTVWLHRDALIARLDAEIAEEADDEAALSEPDRARKTKELQSDAAMVERQLAALVWKARDENVTVEFSEDADVLAVLGIHVVDVADLPVPVDRAAEARRVNEAIIAAMTPATATPPAS